MIIILFFCYQYPLIVGLIFLLIAICCFLLTIIYEFKEPRIKNNILRKKAKEKIMNQYFTEEKIKEIIKGYTNFENSFISFGNNYSDEIYQIMDLILIYYGKKHKYEKYFYKNGKTIKPELENYMFKFIKNNVVLNIPIVKTLTYNHGVKIYFKY